MNQEQPEVPSSTDALLEGLNSDVCKACVMVERTYASPEEATRAYEALKSAQVLRAARPRA